MHALPPQAPALLVFPPQLLTNCCALLGGTPHQWHAAPCTGPGLLPIFPLKFLSPRIANPSYYGHSRIVLYRSNEVKLLNVHVFAGTEMWLLSPCSWQATAQGEQEKGGKCKAWMQLLILNSNDTETGSVLPRQDKSAEAFAAHTPSWCAPGLQGSMQCPVQKASCLHPQ